MHPLVGVLCKIKKNVHSSWVESRFDFGCSNYEASGPGCSVGIATHYGLDGPGSNPGGDEIFPPVQTGPGAQPVSCKMGTGSFPGVEAARAWGWSPHPHLV